MSSWVVPVRFFRLKCDEESNRREILSRFPEDAGG